MNHRPSFTAIALALAFPLTAQQTLRSHDGFGVDDFQGFAVADLGDLDGDGISDYAVGASNASYPGIPGRGRVTVHSGATGAVRLTLIGQRAGARFGWSIAGIGDVSGDGVPDFAVGSPFDDGNGFEAGRVDAFSGADGRRLWHVAGTSGWRSQGEIRRHGSRLGMSIATVDDLDGDLVGEVVVGAPSAVEPSIAFELPRVWFLSGRTGTEWVRLWGADQWGYALTAVPDLDGDGRRELAVASPSASHGPLVIAGMITVLSHASMRTRTFVPYRSIPGTEAGDQLGRVMACPGDLDGDGVPELLCHGLLEDEGFFVGHSVVEVRSLADGRLLRSTRRRSSASRFGSALAGLGDLNGDGVPEYAIAAPSGGGNGQVEILDGATGSRLHLLAGSGGERLGYALASVGDVDGDGRRELLVGAPLANTAASKAGRADLVSLALPGTIWSFGTPCQVSPRGDVGLRATGTGAVGTTVSLRSGPYSGAMTGVLLVGFSDRTWAGGTLPFPLWPVGSPCSLLVSPDIDLVLASRLIGPPNRHEVAFDLQLATDPGARGVELFFQWVALDHQAPAGFAASNGVGLRTGR